MLLDTHIRCDVSGVDGIVSAYVEFNKVLREFLETHSTELMLDSEDMRRAGAVIYLKNIQKLRGKRSTIDIWEVVMDDLGKFAVAEVDNLTRFFDREEKDTWNTCTVCQKASPIRSMSYSSTTGYICEDCL